MRLRDYPRPPNDTGFGIHTSPDWQDRFEQSPGVLERLREMGLCWMMLFVGNDEPATHGDVQKILDAGFEIILRIQPLDGGHYYRFNSPTYVFPIDLLKRYVDAGVRYIRTGNEPFLVFEWDDGAQFQACYPDRLIEIWDRVLDFELANAAAIREAGGIPVMSEMCQAWDPNHLCRYSDLWIRAQERGVLNELYAPPVAQGIHPRPHEGRPPNYPYDISPNATVWYWGTWQDEKLGWKWADQRAYSFSEIEMVIEMMRHFGIGGVPLLGTEAGYEIGWNGPENYGPVSGPLHHAELNLALARYQQERNWPEYFTSCFWHLHRRGADTLFAKEAWFENDVYHVAEMPVVQAFVDAQFPAVRDELFAEEPVEPEFPFPVVIDTVDSLPRSSAPAGRPLDIIDKIVVHHAAAVTTPERTARYHVETKGWPTIGYHYFITGDGTIYYTARLGEITYHCGEHNPTSVGICLSGAFHGDNPPPGPAQQEALVELIDGLLGKLGLERDAIKAHHELTPTLCPGEAWFWDWLNGNYYPTEPSELEQLRQRVDELQDEVAQMQADIYSTVELIGAITEKLGKYS